MAARLKLSGVMAEHARNKAAPGIILPRVKDHMLKTFGPDDWRDPTVVHPSELAKPDWCPLATYQRIISGVWPEEKFDFFRENIYDTGNDIHLKWQGRMIDAGFAVWGDWECRTCKKRVTGLKPYGRAAFGNRCAAPGLDHQWLYDEVTLDARAQLLMTGHADCGFDDTLVEIKGLPLDTPLPTPSGWTTMGEVRVGDVLFSSAGEPTRVTAKSPVKRVKVYRVTFDDGTSQVCDEGHLWPVLSGPMIRAKHQVLPVEEIKATLKLYGQSQHRVVNTKSLQMPDAYLPVDPYIFGQWLGDGTFRNGSAFITGQDDQFDTIRASGAELGNAVNVKPNAHDRCVYHLATVVRQYGLAGVRSPERWIPHQFLRSSAWQRLSLLQGLMDADGTYVTSRRQVQFTSTSKALADGVFELVASLGARPYMQFVRRKGFGLEVDSWDVRWSPTFVPFRMDRKVQSCEDIMATHGGGRRRYRVIKNVEEVPSVPTACVTVDAPDHTYLCGRGMIPTHNSIGLGTLRIDAPELLSAHQEGRMTDLTGLWKAVRRPLRSHLIQGDIYLHLAHILDLPFRQIVYLYEFKPNQLTKEFTIRYDADRVKPLIAKAEYVMYAVEHRNPPKCPKGPAGCKQCKAVPRQPRRTVAGRRADLT